MLEMPQEIEVWYIIPALRRELARELVNLGLRQKDVAKTLGITPSAISQYTKKKRAKDIVFPKAILDSIKMSAASIKHKPDSVRREIQKLCTKVRSSGTLCEIHRKIAKNLDHCKICIK
jgi:uncharacterized protein